MFTFDKGIRKGEGGRQSNKKLKLKRENVHEKFRKGIFRACTSRHKM